MPVTTVNVRLACGERVRLAADSFDVCKRGCVAVYAAASISHVW